MDRLGIVIPCKDESLLLSWSIDSLSRTIDLLRHARPNATVSVVLVDDHSTDDTRSIAANLAGTYEWLEVLDCTGHGEAAARSSGTEHLLGCDPELDWVLACDVDQSYEPTWLIAWFNAIGTSTIGAFGGRDRISPTSAREHPACAVVLTELEELVTRIEAVAGVTNLNGHNHVISRRSYDAAGPYRQVFRSLAPRTRPVPIVGADWDLGVRIRCLGHPMKFAQNATVNEGRRFREGPLDVISGQTYNREFGSNGREYVATEGPAPASFPAAELGAARRLGIRKAMLHYLAKPLIVDASLIGAPLLRPTLGADLHGAIATWLDAHPAAAFDDDRDDTLLRVGPALVDAFLPELCEAFDTFI